MSASLSNMHENQLLIHREENCRVCSKYGTVSVPCTWPFAGVLRVSMSSVANTKLTLCWSIARYSSVTPVNAVQYLVDGMKLLFPRWFQAFDRQNGLQIQWVWVYMLFFCFLGRATDAGRWRFQSKITAHSWQLFRLSLTLIEHAIMRFLALRLAPSP
jgi:hypothetical protein